MLLAEKMSDVTFLDVLVGGLLYHLEDSLPFFQKKVTPWIGLSFGGFLALVCNALLFTLWSSPCLLGRLRTGPAQSMKLRFLIPRFSKEPKVMNLEQIEPKQNKPRPFKSNNQGKQIKTHQVIMNRSFGSTKNRKEALPGRLWAPSGSEPPILFSTSLVTIVFCMGCMVMVMVKKKK